MSRARKNLNIFFTRHACYCLPFVQKIFFGWGFSQICFSGEQTFEYGARHCIVRLENTGKVHNSRKLCFYFCLFWWLREREKKRKRKRCTFCKFHITLWKGRKIEKKRERKRREKNITKFFISSWKNDKRTTNKGRKREKKTREEKKHIGE